MSAVRDPKAKPTRRVWESISSGQMERREVDGRLAEDSVEDKEEEEEATWVGPSR